MGTSKVVQTIKSVFEKKYPTAALSRLTNEGVLSPQQKMIRLLGGIRTEQTGRQRLESVTESDIEKLDIEDLAYKMVKSDSLVDMTVDLYCTLVSLEHSITAATTAGDRAIREINDLLEYKKIPLSLLVSHIVSSMIMRGNICVERVFVDGMPSSVFCLDPRWFRWELQNKTQDGQMWYLGQFTGKNGNWEELDSPNILWVSINPLVGERTGRSPIVTAFDPIIKDTKLLTAMTDVIQTQAFVRRYIQYRALEAKQAKFTDSQIAAMTEKAEKDMQKWGSLAVGEIPVSTDFIQWNQEPGASGATGNGFGFAEISDRMYDRKSIRGAKIPPFVAGSNEFVAESSATSQAKFYSVQLASGQETLAHIVEWVYRGFFRSMGIRTDPVFTTKRTNAVERLEEALTFKAVMDAINQAVSTGISLPNAIQLYEEESGMSFSAEIKRKIQEDYERSLDESDDADPDDEGEPEEGEGDDADE